MHPARRRNKQNFSVQTQAFSPYERTKNSSNKTNSAKTIMECRNSRNNYHLDEFNQLRLLWIWTRFNASVLLIKKKIASKYMVSFASNAVHGLLRPYFQ